MPNPEHIRPILNRVLAGLLEPKLCRRCEEPRQDWKDDLCDDCRREINAAFADLPGAEP